MAEKASNTITQSSTAEYFAKNLQQVGFSSPAKAVLTTLKEAFDNSLDACEEHGILPDIRVEIKKVGKGSLRNTDRISVMVEDNGPGLEPDVVAMVFGEYLASSKFGRGRCSRGQQGIGISAATTWAVQTSATGAKVLTKTKASRKALSCLVVNDLKKNKGIIKDKELVEWNKVSGTRVEFLLDGRLQLNGEGGILAYLRGSILLNPHLRLSYSLPDMPEQVMERVSDVCPQIPEASLPHPHTMKLGEFISHSRLFGQQTLGTWLQKGFSRIGETTLQAILTTANLPQTTAKKSLTSLSTEEFTALFTAIQSMELKPPSTDSVMCIGEQALSMSIQRLGEIDFFSVVSRRPLICDFKPVQVEIAIARVKGLPDNDESVTVLRFANRVPLQFDKAACAIVKAISTINWKSYGLKQSKNSLPSGPYIIAVSVISPFIKFKNASKETIDASDELVEEIRRALMKGGQQISRHLNREHKAREWESKTAHIEKFSPILVETLCRILSVPESRKIKAQEGLKRILHDDSHETLKELEVAEEKLSEHIKAVRKNFDVFAEEDERLRELDDERHRIEREAEALDEEAAEESKPQPKGKASKAATKKKIKA